MDGSLSFSINAHRELCAIQKPGEVAVTPALILKGSFIIFTDSYYNPTHFPTLSRTTHTLTRTDIQQ